MKTKKQTRASKAPKSRKAPAVALRRHGSADRDRPFTRAIKFILAEEPTDTDRLNWLVENHVSLTAVKERWDDDTVAHWWQVTDGKKSLSGNPLADPREAIDAAVLRQNGKSETRRC